VSEILPIVVATVVLLLLAIPVAVLRWSRWGPGLDPIVCRIRGGHRWPHPETDDMVCQTCGTRRVVVDGKPRYTR
jgi:hypothetical protein